MAACIASTARRSPEERPVPMSAMPCSAMMVRTSAKSTFTRPCTVMRSEMPCTALRSTSSARLNASASDMFSPATERSRWFGMTMSVSTAALSSASPCSACLRRLFPSKRNGFVTTPTVRAPVDLAMSATTGAPPVPVPPPIPAVTNTMSAPSSAATISIALLEGGGAPHLGVRPRAEAARRAPAELDLDARPVRRERLHVRVGRDELDALEAAGDHRVDRVAAAASDADHLDPRAVLLVRVLDHGRLPAG